MLTKIERKTEDGKVNPESTTREGIVRKFYREIAFGVNKLKISGKSDLDFFMGGEGQWDSKILTDWSNKNKPALTYNEVKPLIRNDSGYIRQNRKQCKLFPKQGGTVEFAQVATEVINHFENLSNLDYLKPEALEIGEVMGEAFLSVNRDYTVDVGSGDISIRLEDTRFVYADPLCKDYDLNLSGRFIWAMRFAFTKEEVQSYYPEIDVDKLGEPSVPYDYEGSDGLEAQAKAYLIAQCWWVNYTKHPDTGKLKKTLNLTILVGNPTVDKAYEVAADIVDPFNGHESMQYRARFPIVRFCPEFKFGQIKSEIKDLRGPAMEVNIRKSQLVHNLMEQVGSGYWIWEDSLDEDDEEDLRAGKHNLLVHVKGGKNKPERIENARLSEGHLAVANDNIIALQRIKGTNPQSIGTMPMEREDLSGVAMDKRIIQGQVTNMAIFDRFAYTEKILYETVLELIQNTDVLTEEEMLAIVQESNKEVYNQLFAGALGDEQAAQSRTETLVALLKDRMAGSYGVTSGTKASDPGERQNKARTLLTARKIGIQIPDSVIIKYLDISEEDIKEIQAAQQAAAMPPGIPNGGMPGMEGIGG